MRNRYGVWTQERWMRSFYFDFLRTNKKAPAPYSEQRYAVREATPESKKKRGKEKGEAERDTNSSPEPHVPSLVTSDATLPIQLTGGSLIYDKREDSWTKTAETREEWMARIPYEDPYREERRMPVTATGDFRYFILSRLANNLGSPGKVQNSLMSVDLGVRVRPFSDYFQVVVEPRFMNGPQNLTLSDGFTSEARIRSAYVISDNLPYNSYAMYGLFRPMFGHYDPNHFGISATLSGLSQRSVYNAFGVGTAPNVPFFNFNFIAPIHNTTYDQSTGFVTTLGARFVTLGANLAFSFWNTDTPDATGTKLNRRMWALTGGFTLDRFIFSGEMLSVSKEFAKGKRDSGIAYTGQLMFQLFNETYAVFNIAVSNLALNLKQGSADEMMVGVKSIFAAGTEVEILWVNRNNLVGTVADNQKMLQLQTHLFF